MHTSPRAPVADLFLGVSSLLSQRKVPLAVAILSFAMLLAVGSAAVRFRILHIEDGLMSEFSLDRDVLRTEIEKDLTKISEMDVSEFIRQGGFQSGQTSSLGLRYVRLTMPVIALQMFFNAAVMFIAGVFFLLLFTRGSESGYDAAQRLPRTIARMCGLVLWMLVRSFIWILPIGPLIAVYMLPRLALAPVILAGGEAGIFQSMQLSMKRTSRRWLAMFIRLVLIAIVAFLILWPMLVITVGITLLSMKLGYLLLLCALLFSIAYQCAALTVLAALMA